MRTYTQCTLYMYMCVYHGVLATGIDSSACICMLEVVILHIFVGLRGNPFALEDHPQTSWPPL